jgi:hypothetical protein
MKKISLALAILCLLTANVQAQTEAEMKAWQEYMTPGDQHKVLASMDGEWDGDVTTWHAPNTEGSVSKSTTANKMIMGGRYQISNHTGNMMGMPFEGMSITGFDNAKKKFIATWIDNVGTGIMVLEGGWNAATKTMTLTGKAVDPSAGNAKEMAVRQTFRIVDANTHLMEMFGPGPDGKEYKMMQIKMTKKK